MSNTYAVVADVYFHAMSLFIRLLNHVLINLLDSFKIFPYFFMVFVGQNVVLCVSV